MNKQTKFSNTANNSKFLRFLRRDLIYWSQVCSKKLGDPSLSISELLEAIDFIQVVFNQRIRFFKIIAGEYQKGLSLSEIATKVNKSKWFVRSCLSKEGIKLRNKYAEAMALRKLKRGKQGARPYYGFCYFEGEIVKDPREYPTLVLIHDLWKEGKTIHQIVKELNNRSLTSRTGRRWSWAAVSLVIARFRDGLIQIN